MKGLGRLMPGVMIFFGRANRVVEVAECNCGGTPEGHHFHSSRCRQIRSISAAACVLEAMQELTEADRHAESLLAAARLESASVASVEVAISRYEAAPVLTRLLPRPGITLVRSAQPGKT
jgi:hypothetical protein